MATCIECGMDCESCDATELNAENNRLKATLAAALTLATESQPPDMFLKFKAILAPEKSAAT